MAIVGVPCTPSKAQEDEHNPAAQGETAIDPHSAPPSPRHASCSSNRSCSSSRSCRSCSSNRSCSSSRSCSSGRCLPFYSPGLAPRHQGGGRWSGALRPSSEGGKRSSRTLGRRKRETRTSCLLRNIQKVQTRSPSSGRGALVGKPPRARHPARRARAELNARERKPLALTSSP